MQLRIIDRPEHIRALDKLRKHVLGSDAMWFATRYEITKEVLP